MIDSDNERWVPVLCILTPGRKDLGITFGVGVEGGFGSLLCAPKGVLGRVGGGVDVVEDRNGGVAPKKLGGVVEGVGFAGISAGEGGKQIPKPERIVCGELIDTSMHSEGRPFRG